MLSETSATGRFLSRFADGLARAIGCTVWEGAVIAFTVLGLFTWALVASAMYDAWKRKG